MIYFILYQPERITQSGKQVSRSRNQTVIIREIHIMAGTESHGGRRSHQRSIIDGRELENLSGHKLIKNKKKEQEKAIMGRK